MVLGRGVDNSLVTEERGAGGWAFCIAFGTTYIPVLGSVNQVIPPALPNTHTNAVAPMPTVLSIAWVQALQFYRISPGGTCMHFLYVLP